MADPQRRKRRTRTGGGILLWIDKWMVQISAGLVVGIYAIADATGLLLSDGTKASMGAFVAYAVVKGRTDQRWRALEVEQHELKDLVEALDKSQPGSPEAIQVRKELVALARRAQASGEEG